MPSKAPERAPLLLVLDSHGIIYRSYFALRDTMTLRRTGEPVWAVYGYASTLLYVLNELKPTHVIAAWDAPGGTFRHDADAEYKATRAPTPDDLPPQMDRVRSLLDAFRIPVIEVPGYEADDVVGALATQASESGVEMVVMTLDNDMVQLVEPGVRVYMYRPYQRDYVMYDEAKVRERWGFEPDQIRDYKALVGDNSDNISGVKGIGEKGAKTLIEQWGRVEEMIDHLEELKPPRAQKALDAGREDAIHSKFMATIVRDVPGVDLDLDTSQVSDYDRDAVLEMFRELEFRSLVSRLPAHASDTPAPGERAQPATVTVEAREYQVVTTKKDLTAMVKAVRSVGRFAFEVVADDEHPMRASGSLVGIGISVASAKGWYVPFGHTQEPPPPIEGQQEMEVEAPDPLPALDQLTQAVVLKAIAPLFTSDKIERVTHNAKAGELAFGEAESGFSFEVGFDTMVAAYLLGDSNVTVRALAFERLGQELVEPKTLLGTGRKAIPFSRTSPEDCAHLAAGNADMALRLTAELAGELEAGGVREVFEQIDMPHVAVLARMERYGLALDLPVLDQLRDELEEGIGTAERAVFEAVGHEFQIGSPQQLSHVLFEEIELPTTRKTKTGYSTDANALEPLRHDHPAVNAVLEWRELTKIKSTYVDTLPKQINSRTDRVHTVFSQVTAATGRLSSNDPNLQNIPVRGEAGAVVRRAFIAKDCGKQPIYLSVDYSQIELRVLAHICGDDELRRAFDAGEDIHASTSSRVFGVPLDEVTTEMRRRAKVFNFGVLYGLTAFGLSQREGIPRDEAEEFITNYFEAYPSVAEWRDQTVDEARARGYSETLTGRRRYIPDLRASNRNRRMAAERIAINMPIQGTAADIIKIAMNQIDVEMTARQEQGKLARMVLQVHDELIFELPTAELEEVREITQRLMPAALELSVPLDLEEKWGPSWGELE
ncbi:MAG TPA: DNA polymerase I [Dehalococcoidia bacterium]|nr:DNA polymerase I [Dehalococcoidia bacterium]